DPPGGAAEQRGQPEQDAERHQQNSGGLRLGGRHRAAILVHSARLKYVVHGGGAHARGLDLDNQLNVEQRQVVTAPDGPALVIAGAGSGKTRALTYRVAWLLARGIAPVRILLATFTNRAAREMVRR